MPKIERRKKGEYPEFLSREKAITEEELAGCEKAKKVLNALKNDARVRAYLMQANVQTVQRLGFNDHGWVHAEIVTANALRMLGLLNKRGIKPSTVASHGFPLEDAKIVVLCGAYLHDIGNSIHRDDHERNSLILALPILEDVLSRHYSDEKLYIMISEILHCIYSHDDAVSLTIESGVVTVGDGSDSAEGRSRVPFKLGSVDIHTLSAQSIKSVEIVEGRDKPIRIEVAMKNPAAIFQIQEILMVKLKHSGLEKHVEIVAKLVEDSKDIIKEVKF